MALAVGIWPWRGCQLESTRLREKRTEKRTGFPKAQTSTCYLLVNLFATTQVRDSREGWTYPELAQQHGRARLVVLGCEVEGRWSEKSCLFLASLAAAKARCEPDVMRKSTMLLLASSVEHPQGLHRQSVLPVLTGAQVLRGS